MEHPRNLKIEDFTYPLPEEKIAIFPLAERDHSRLLIYREGKLSTDIYRNIAEHLPPGSLLIFNDTRVIQARLLFAKPTGGIIEIFALEPDGRYKDITTAMLQKGSVVWECLLGGAAKWKEGQTLQKPFGNESEASGMLEARVTERHKDGFTITFNWEPASLSFAEVLHQAGAIPIPPYLKRQAEQTDTERYQTIYARHEGSVAAPTAGLHFTESIFQSLRNKHIIRDFVTLHVGAGTFMPVKSNSLEGHQMHEEFIDVSTPLIKNLIDHPASVFCVGTTSLRTVESLYWMGVKCLTAPAISYEELAIKQWEVYDIFGQVAATPADALHALLQWMEENKHRRLIIKTQLLIAPGYTFRLCAGLITNFHQPQSTLLLLVAALIGDDWQRVYEYALKEDFRFLSYGDGCLLFNRTATGRNITCPPAAFQ